MTCAEIEDRLFDEDCRAALLGRGALPDDVAAHLALCPRCVRSWAGAAADARHLSERLLQAPPPALLEHLHDAYRRRAREAPAPRARPRALRVDEGALAWAVASGVLGALLAGAAQAGVREWEGFCVGASLGLALVALRSASPGWRAPIGLLRATSRGLARLAQAI